MCHDLQGDREKKDEPELKLAKPVQGHSSVQPAPLAPGAAGAGVASDLEKPHEKLNKASRHAFDCFYLGMVRFSQSPAGTV